MTNHIKEGASGVGAEVAVKAVSDADMAFAFDCDILVLGCPSMGAEVLEESEFEPFIMSIEGKILGKKLALFGSYGWGDGEWMRNFEERVKGDGAILTRESLIVNEASAGDECVASVRRLQKIKNEVFYYN